MTPADTGSRLTPRTAAIGSERIQFGKEKERGDGHAEGFPDIALSGHIFPRFRGWGWLPTARLRD
jgi:hypothetical protein